MQLQSWGNYPRVSHRGYWQPRHRDEIARLLESANGKILPRGLGRSYGDCCLNENGYLLLTHRLNGILSFNEKTGVLCCEAGLSLADIVQRFLPCGWFLPVTPGTQYVTVGGAIANDVHGKNQHNAGSFANHVLKFLLLRSDGAVLNCSPQENPHWFRATIGGLGLTGVILQAEIQLKKIPGSRMAVKTSKFANLNEFEQLSRETGAELPYTVAWLDALNFNKGFGQGLFMAGRHLQDESKQPFQIKRPPRLNVPFNLPNGLLSPGLLRWYNRFHFNKYKAGTTDEIQSIEAFFYPLDKIANWNRLYGKRGFLQWQCVIPEREGLAPVKAILSRLKRHHLGAYLAVLKRFGEVPSRGLLSFPMPGVTLAMDFPNVGEPLFSLLERLDEIVLETGGRIYPAKDARMSSQVFKKSFPNYSEFQGFIDPKFSSSFIRRVVQT